MMASSAIHGKRVLASLIERIPPVSPTKTKWSIPQRNFIVNDVVLVLEENKPRCNWPLGRVIQVYTNAGDKLVRSVKLKTSSSELVRSVDKIVLLEEDPTGKQ
jgi:hypothetical protein